MSRASKALGLALAVAVVFAAQGGTAPSSQVREVSMPGKAFAPDRLTILVGDTVVWRNGDSATHTATANDDAFDSGRLAPGGTFAHLFPRAGRYAYHCTIHKFMRGEVLVVPVALEAPETPVPSGAVAELRGLAPEGVTEVLVEQIDPAGPTRRAVPAADGTFSVRVRTIVPTSFQARAGTAATPRVRVEVSPRVSARVVGRRVVAAVAPARPGATALLQWYDRERFDWRTVARGTVDGSRVSLSVPQRVSGTLRILVRGGGGWGDGASRAVRVS
jgi:plastocyanin